MTNRDLLFKLHVFEKPIFKEGYFRKQTSCYTSAGYLEFILQSAIPTVNLIFCLLFWSTLENVLFPLEKE